MDTREREWIGRKGQQWGQCEEQEWWKEEEEEWILMMILHLN